MKFEHLAAFAEEQWWVILIALIVLIIVIKVVKTIIKWLIVAVIVIVLVLYGLNYEPIQNAVGKVAEYSLDLAFDLMSGEANEAVYEVNEDGTFTVTSKSIRLTGSLDSDKVTVYVNNVRVAEVTITDAIEAFIEVAKEKSP